MIKLKLPFWLEGLELTKLVATAQHWWEQATEWLRWPYLVLGMQVALIKSRFLVSL